MTSGCEAIRRFVATPAARPNVVTLQDDTVPHFIDRGEPAPFDGVIISKPLLNELAPCFEGLPGDEEPLPIPP